MRIASILLLATLSLSASPVLAGSVSFTDGQGTWRPTSCHEPQAPAVSAHNAEAAASDLNARRDAQALYNQEVESYMACISQEAQRDADSVARGIVRAAEAEIKNAQAKAAAQSLSQPAQ